MLRERQKPKEPAQRADNTELRPRGGAGDATAAAATAATAAPPVTPASTPMTAAATAATVAPATPAAAPSAPPAAAAAPAPTYYGAMFERLRHPIQAPVVPPPSLYPALPAAPAAAADMQKSPESAPFLAAPAPAAAVNSPVAGVVTQPLHISAEDFQAGAAALTNGKRIDGQDNALLFHNKETLRAALLAIAAHYAVSDDLTRLPRVCVVERDTVWQVEVPEPIEDLKQRIAKFASTAEKTGLSISSDIVQQIIEPLRQLRKDFFSLGRGTDKEGKHEWVHIGFDNDAQAHQVARALAFARALGLTTLTPNPMDYPIVQLTDLAHQGAAHPKGSVFIRIHSSEWPYLAGLFARLRIDYPVDFNDQLSHADSAQAAAQAAAKAAAPREPTGCILQ